ncbi:hypothetical protein EOD39_9617 [Acipenser ruthenus]|uniref:Uncharacterized protein n=1 Tax=Acipenser ruthenus TaxID=7906 RepID=A0A444U081_ACIRT|nr:hypothetical protein EOD39_9617 [Acipenser ruthenus]
MINSDLSFGESDVINTHTYSEKSKVSSNDMDNATVYDFKQSPEQFPIVQVSRQRRYVPALTCLDGFHANPILYTSQSNADKMLLKSTTCH